MMKVLLQDLAYDAASVEVRQQVVSVSAATSHRMCVCVFFFVPRELVCIGALTGVSRSV